MKAAKAAGAVTSLRSQLPREAVEHLGRPAKAPSKSLDRIVEHVDVLVGNEEDLQKGLGIEGPGRRSASRKLDPSAFFGMIDKVVEKHPQREGRRHHAARGALAPTATPGARSPGSTARPTVAHLRARRASTASAAATASPPASSTACSAANRREEAVKLGWAHGALLTTFPGDTTMATRRAGARLRQGRLGAHPAVGRHRQQLVQKGRGFHSAPFLLGRRRCPQAPVAPISRRIARDFRQFLAGNRRKRPKTRSSRRSARRR